MEKYKRILIVGKNKDFLSELTNYLLSAGFRNIESLNSYKSALTRLKHKNFDVVLIDILTPKMKELSHAHEIRSIRSEIKIFLMIEPEHQELICKEVLTGAKFNCIFKFFIKDNLLKLF